MSLICDEGACPPYLIQNKDITISCRYCGVEDAANVMPGRGPHAYALNCAHCGKHHKWASKYDVENISNEDLLQRHSELEEIVKSQSHNGFSHEFHDMQKIEKILKERGVIK